MSAPAANALMTDAHGDTHAAPSCSVSPPPTTSPGRPAPAAKLMAPVALVTLLLIVSEPVEALSRMLMAAVLTSSLTVISVSWDHGVAGARRGQFRLGGGEPGSTGLCFSA